MEQVRLGYRPDLAWLPADLFEEALSHFYPRGSNREALERFFQNKVTYKTIHSWRTGHRNIPRWALELLAARHRDRINVHRNIITCLEITKAGPGLKAGAVNLAAWKARRS